MLMRNLARARDQAVFPFPDLVFSFSLLFSPSLNSQEDDVSDSQTSLRSASNWKQQYYSTCRSGMLQDAAIFLEAQSPILPCHLRRIVTKAPDGSHSSRILGKLVVNKRSRTGLSMSPIDLDHSHNSPMNCSTSHGTIQTDLFRISRNSQRKISTPRSPDQCPTLTENIED
jgi:hypothetical protein